MKIALIARFDNSGLGTLSWEFSQHLKPYISRILLVQNGVYQTFPERYAEFETRTIKPQSSFTKQDEDWLLEKVDILLSFETFYSWSIITRCRARKIKSVLITMYEMTPDRLPLCPDVFLCPSRLDFEYFKTKLPKNSYYLPIPVNTEKLVWRKREKAETFIHTASHGGVAGRKGTGLLLNAMKHVKSDIKLTIYTWQPILASNKDPRIEIKLQNFKNYWQIWQNGDILVYPQDYNGICLPIVEAMASGLGVITTDIYPFNEYFPRELMFKPVSYYKTRCHLGLIEVEAAKIRPEDIAEKIDEWAHQDISQFSEYGRQWAVENSWEKLSPKYVKLLESLI